MSLKSVGAYLPVLGVALAVAYFAGVAHSNGPQASSTATPVTVTPEPLRTAPPVVADPDTIRSAATKMD